MDNKYLEIFPKIPIGRAEDLTNQFFGKWKVLYRTINDNSGKPMWVCECQCERHIIKPVSAKTLKAHTSTNCGCKRLKTISDKADAKIHMKDKEGNIIKKRCFRCQQWLPLTDFWKSSSTKDGYGGECKKCQSEAKENRYNIYKKNAKKRNLTFNLSKEDFFSLISQPCYYCGDFEKYSGIDRKDSSKGYEIKNCVPCCEYCNKMKLDYNIDFWFQHMEKILQYQKREAKYE